ncbi:MAG: GTP cyclohydrolase I FolE [Saprospiraceae bacterium]|nr:GTP cyclohydrolase I FolE [Saprospiraceae bacterium]MCB0623562.1 GTP cyclohydrolase I FolE [Saprospiraceae bacterium]
MNLNKGSLNGSRPQPALSLIEEIGDEHLASATDTPLRADAFELSDPEKIERIEAHFREIMELIGLDLSDDSLQGTPRRVAKMYVQEIFSGLKPDNKPSATLFENKFQYRNMLIEKNIRVQSFCEHHFLPIYGTAHVAYISSGQVIGLSKLNRIVEYYSRRPQVQERLTMQIAAELKEVLQTEDVAVYLDAKHMCVQMRGVEHPHSSTITADYSGKFLNDHYRQEFLQAIRG